MKSSFQNKCLAYFIGEAYVFLRQSLFSLIVWVGGWREKEKNNNNNRKKTHVHLKFYFFKNTIKKKEFCDNAVFSNRVKTI